MKKITVKVVRLAHARDLPLPAYQTPQSAGLDLLAAVPHDAPLTLQPGAVAQVPTGLTLELPRGTEAQVRPRSGLAAKHAVTVLNSPGTVDADYRGEVQVLLINHGRTPFTIQRGDRIAQMVVASLIRASFKEARSLKGTQRGSGGFGSTGTAAGLRGAGKKPFALPGRKTKTVVRRNRRGKNA